MCFLAKRSVRKEARGGGAVVRRAWRRGKCGVGVGVEVWVAAVWRPRRGRRRRVDMRVEEGREGGEGGF